MLRRLGVAALVAGAVTLQPLGARAGDPPAGAAGTPADAGRAAARGAVVVAVGDDAASPARALALLVYRDAGLRPSIDDATARVLAGEAVPATASAGEAARLQELAQLRASLSGAAAGTSGAAGAAAATPGAAGTPGAAATPAAAPGAAPGAGAASGAAAASGGTNDAVERRILAGIGAEARATHLVVVRVREGRATARVLRVGNASWEAVEIAATAQTDVSGTTYTWPAALEVLRAIVVAPGAARPKAAAAGIAPKRAALAPATSGKAGADAGKSSGFWSSPWFWVVLGGVVAAGATTFIVAGEAGGDDNVTQVQGTVPR